MHSISATQIKSARACLDWTREDLANATGLSVATIRNMELGNVSRRGSEIVRRTVESKGWEFTDYEGIRRRAKEIDMLTGADSIELFYGDIMQTLKIKHGDVIVAVQSQQFMMKSLGVSVNGGFDRLRKLGELAKIRCLLTENHRSELSIPNVEFRAIPKHCLGPSFYYVYGNRYVVALPQGKDGLAFKFVLHTDIELAQSYKDHFDLLWKMSLSPVAEKLV